MMTQFCFAGRFFIFIGFGATSSAKAPREKSCLLNAQADRRRIV
jgi:hypothetical protein